MLLDGLYNFLVDFCDGLLPTSSFDIVSLPSPDPITAHTGLLRQPVARFGPVGKRARRQEELSASHLFDRCELDKHSKSNLSGKIIGFQRSLLILKDSRQMCEG